MLVEGELGRAFPVGFQTIIWGRQLRNIERALDLLQACGFQGVEFCQHPSELCGGDYAKLRVALAGRGLQLLGLTGGTLGERMQFLGKDREPYLYIDEWNPEAVQHAWDAGFHVAAHPHAFKGFDRLEDAFKILYDNPRLWWIPDTAHLTVACEKVDRAIRRYANRVPAIHLDDWTPVYGRASQRYSRGFTPLGQGTLDLDGIAHFIHEQDWHPRADGLPVLPWIVVEQDFSDDLPGDIARAARWLRAHSFQIQPPPDNPAWVAGWTDQRQAESAPSEERPARDHFIRAMWAASRNRGEAFYAAVAKEWALAAACPVVAIWSHSPADRMLSLVAKWPADLDIAEETRQVPDVDRLARLAIESQSITVFDLEDENPAAPYPRDHTARMDSVLAPQAQARGLRYLVMAPVFNSHNPHQVRFLVEFLAARPPSGAEALLGNLARDFGEVADLWLSDRCLTSAALANLRVEKSETVKAFCQKLADVLGDVVEAEGATVFLEDRLSGEGELRFAASTVDIAWASGLSPDEQCYRKGDGLAGGVWKTLRPRLIPQALTDPLRLTKSVDNVEHPERAACLFAPLRDQSGTAYGVVRLRNRRDPDHRLVTYFLDDDLAAVESVFQAVVPDLTRMRASEERRIALMTLAHELKRPLVGMRGSLSMLQMKIESGTSLAEIQNATEIDDALAWSELSQRLIQKTELLAIRNPKPVWKQVDLKREILDPVLRQTQIALADHKMHASQISVLGFEQIPPLYVDKASMQQIFFNLIDNAVKYGSKTASPKVVVVAKRWRQRFYFQFRDWGIGIPDGWEQKIFQEQTRAPNAIQNTAPGQGLGLSVVRAALKLYGGKIAVTSMMNPTEFTITLKASFAEHPPQAESGEGE